MGLFEDMHKQGTWRGYERHVVMLEPILRRMSERGIPVDIGAFNIFADKLREAKAVALAEMQTIVPLAAKKLKMYKREPRVRPEECIRTADNRWGRPQLWKPSSQALIRYMRYRNHTVPKSFKTQKDTTNALELKRIARSTKDPLYSMVLRYRKAATVLDNHMDNWRPGADGKLHPTFYFDPATGQLSSRRPNAQNAPHHDDAELGIGYATEFRSMVKASPGCTIVEADFSGFHVQTLGFEAQDADLMRIGRADLHSFVTAHFKHLPFASQLFRMNDADLRAKLKEVKRDYKHDRDAKVKHAILGYNNGMGYKKLYKQYQEYFENEREAKSVHQFMDTLFPKSKLYREMICQKAHEQGYLVSRHGYIRYFWEVFRYDGHGGWSHGDDHEAALCFFTQNDAHGELKERLLEMDALGLLERFGFINTIHDSLMFDCPNEVLAECVAMVKAIMEAPSKVLIDPVVAPNGLVVGVEIKAGPDWANMKMVA